MEKVKSIGFLIFSAAGCRPYGFAFKRAFGLTSGSFLGFFHLLNDTHPKLDTNFAIS
jgi:hypothetical protein